MAARGPAAARRSRTELQTLRGTVLMVRNIRLRPVSGLRLFCVIRNVFFFLFQKAPGISACFNFCGHKISAFVEGRVQNRRDEHALRTASSIV